MELEGHHLSLRTEGGQEVALIESLLALPAESVEGVLVAMNEASFIFKGEPIHKITEEFEVRVWSLMTKLIGSISLGLAYALLNSFKLF